MTSVVRSIKNNAPLLSLLVAVDLAEKKPVLRGLIDLVDPCAVVPRLGAALAPGPLDAATLARNPTLRVVAQRVLACVYQQTQQPGGGDGGDGGDGHDGGGGPP